MSELIAFPQPSGPNYVIPDVDDENWGQNVTDFLLALPNGVVPTAGVFTLTGDLALQGGFVLGASHYSSLSSNIASAGFLQMANNTDFLSWRNAANSANLLLGVNASDQLTFNGNVVPTGGTGNLTDAGTDGIIVTGGTGAVLGAGTSLAQHVADSSHNGYLSSTDWTTFNAKQAALTLPLTVANGGTGDSSLTAYAVLCGGTTSTGVVQSVASLGSSGDVLTSNGAGALPTFQPSAGGSGTVNSGTATQLAYYPASTNAVSAHPDISMSGGILSITKSALAPMGCTATNSSTGDARFTLSSNSNTTVMALDSSGNFRIAEGGIDFIGWGPNYGNTLTLVETRFPFGLDLVDNTHKIYLSAPVGLGVSYNVFFPDAQGAKGSSFQNDGSGNLSYGFGSLGSAALANQTADISPAVLYTTAAAGLYQVSMYLITSTADGGAGTATATIGYTDPVQAQSLVLGSVNLATGGVVSQVTYVLQATASSDITYAISHSGTYGSAAYNLYISVKRLV